MVIVSKVTVLVLTIVQNFLSVTPKDIDLQEQCEHEHTSFCQKCNDIAVCCDKIKQAIKDEGTKFYNEEQREDVLHDFQWAAKAINNWRAHIMRSTNQDHAKQDVLETLNYSSNLIIIYWAIKFLQIRYREKQSDWFGKRGLSWHIKVKSLLQA